MNEPNYVPTREIDRLAMSNAALLEALRKITGEADTSLLRPSTWALQRIRTLALDAISAAKGNDGN